MPVLVMIRRELYAQARAGGKTLEAAHLEAGYEGNASAAHKLESRYPEVKTRIAELMEQNDAARQQGMKEAAKAQAFDEGLTRAEVLAGLRKVFEMAVEARPISKTVKGKAITVGYTVNLQAANRALELMGKEAGMFIDRKHITVDRIERMDLKQLQAAILDIDTQLAELRRLPAPLIDVTPNMQVGGGDGVQGPGVGGGAGNRVVA